MLRSPAAIVDHLLAAADPRTAAVHLRPTIDLSVIEELKRRVDALKLRNAQQALTIAEIGLDLADAHADPLVTGLAYWAYGNALFHRSRFREAYNAYQHAETFYNPERNPLERTRLHINQIAALQDLGAFSEALTVAAQARAACAQIGAEAEPFLALLEMNSGAVYHQLGRADEALAAYEHGRAILLRHGNRVEMARIDINRANVLQELGRFTEAVELYSAARAALEQAGMAQEVARAEHNLGKLAYRRGQYQAALRHLEAARAGYAAIPNPLEVAKADLYRALVYRDLNLLSETVELAGAAERAFARADTRWERAMALLVAGSGHARLRQAAAAERFLAHARRLLRAQGALERLPALDLERAAVLLTAGRPASAGRIAARVARRSAAEPALAARAHLLLAAVDLAQTPPRAARALDRVAAAYTLAERHDLPERANALFALGQAQEAAGAPQAALTAYQRAGAALNAVRARLPVDTMQLAFLDDKLPIYHAAARLSLEQGDTASALAALSQALNAPIAQPTAPPPELAAELRRLRERWHWQHTRIDDLTEGGAARSPAAHRAATERLNGLEHAIADLVLRGAATGTASAGPTPQTITGAALLHRIQAVLAPDEGLLVGAPLGAQIGLILITRTTVRAHLAPAPHLERTLRAWRFQIHHGATAGVADPTTVTAHLQRFHTLFVAPFAAEIQHLARLAVAFDPAWHDLPLAAAFDGTHYLVERLELRAISTPIALLDQPLRPAPAAYASLVVGHSDGGRLPNTLHEAEAIAAVHAARGPVACLLEQAATPTQVRDALPAAGLIHIAAHAVFRPDNPRFSWIRLHGGRLAVADFADLHLTGRPLVILSACETGRGLPRGGGLLGMGRALLLAGAGGLVVSLWPLADTGAATLMPTFHRALLDATEPAAALAAAQRRAITTGSSPFDWAGFIVIER